MAEHEKERGTATETDTEIPSWQWAKDLMEKTEKEIIRMMKDNPELAWKRMAVVCSEEKCSCSKDFENIDFGRSKSKEEGGVIFKLIHLLENEKCPHVSEEQELSTTEKELESQPLDNISATNHLTLDHISNESNPECSCTKALILKSRCTVQAGITAIHIASVFGKAKVVEFIINATREKIRSPYFLECEDMITSVHQTNPYYHAVHHRQGHVLELLISFLTSAMGCSSVYMDTIAGIMKEIVERDDLKYLKILQSSLENVNWDQTHNINCSFMNAIENRCLKCLKYLGKKGANLHQYCYSYMNNQNRDDVIMNMLLRDDQEVLQEVLKMKAIDFNHILYYAVRYDNKMATTLILEKYKKQLSMKNYYRLPVVILAVLNNSVSMLELLLKDEDIRVNQTHQKYTALNWAKALHFDKCASLLTEAGVPCDGEISRNYPPLVMLFDENITSFYYSKIILVQRMLEYGHDVNQESVNGITPLYAVLKSRSYSCVRIMLASGADPFIGRNCLSAFVSRRLLGELLYANVDLFRSRTEISLLRQLLFSSKKYQNHIGFLLTHAHTIPHNDRKLLMSLQESKAISKDVLMDIEHFLTKPKYLVQASRDILRKHYGYNIHEFVKVSNLPIKIKSILTFEGELEAYLSAPFA